jgi:hypothetical protein
VWSRLTSAGRLTRAELVACAALLTVVGLVYFGSHATAGGFLMDDWSNAAKSRYLASCCHVGQTGSGAGWPSQFHNMLNDGPAGYHLGLPVVVPVVHFLFGVHMGLHLLLAIMLGVGMSFAAYLLMRAVGLEPLPSGVIAALALVFPWADSLRLWAMAGFNQIAVILWVAGVFAAFRGLRARGTARAAAWHALALAVYALGILMYELVGGLVAASFVFYLLRGANWRQALVRVPVDGVCAYLALTYVKNNTLPRPILSVSETIEHAGQIAEQSFTLLALATFPFGQPSRNIVVGLIVLALLAGVVAWWRLPAGDPVRERVRRWLVVTVAGAAVVAAGYVTLAPAHYGTPLDVGIENRLNMVSAFGYAAILYAAASIAGLLIATRWRRPALAPALAVGLSLLVAIGYFARIDTSKEQYAAAYEEGQRVLDGISSATAGQPKQGSVTFVFGNADFIAPGVPVFAWIWDLTPAVKVHFQDPSLAAFPMLPGTTFKCEEDRMFPESSFGTGPGEAAGYGNAYFVDAPSGKGELITSRKHCEEAKERYEPGPLIAGQDCALWGGGPATRLAWHCAERPRT